MYSFGRRSKDSLITAHRDLQRICNYVIRYIDFTVLEGHRNEERQNKLYEEKKSKLKFPKSKHNYNPSLAIDIAPYPIDWAQKKKSLARFYFLAGMFEMAAISLKQDNLISHSIRWGGDWDSDRDYYDQSFDDLCHFELIS